MRPRIPPEVLDLICCTYSKLVATALDRGIETNSLSRLYFRQPLRAVFLISWSSCYSGTYVVCLHISFQLSFVFIRLLGLIGFVETNCETPQSLHYRSEDLDWPHFLHVGVVVALYWFLATEIRFDNMEEVNRKRAMGVKWACACCSLLMPSCP